MVEVITEKEVTMHEDVLTITETRHEVHVTTCVAEIGTDIGIEAKEDIREPPVKQLSGEDEREEATERIQAELLEEKSSLITESEKVRNSTFNFSL